MIVGLVSSSRLRTDRSSRRLPWWRSACFSASLGTDIYTGNAALHLGIREYSGLGLNFVALAVGGLRYRRNPPQSRSEKTREVLMAKSPI